MNARERLGGLTTARQHARRACVEGVPEGTARLPQGITPRGIPYQAWPYCGTTDPNPACPQVTELRKDMRADDATTARISRAPTVPTVASAGSRVNPSCSFVACPATAHSWLVQPHRLSRRRLTECAYVLSRRARPQPPTAGCFKILILVLLISIGPIFLFLFQLRR